MQSGKNHPGKSKHAPGILFPIQAKLLADPVPDLSSVPAQARIKQEKPVKMCGFRNPRERAGQTQVTNTSGFFSTFQSPRQGKRPFQCSWEEEEEEEEVVSLGQSFLTGPHRHCCPKGIWEVPLTE